MIGDKKELDELHCTIWNMANDLRGSADGRDFKQYVLGMLFYGYISENFDLFVNAGELVAGNKDFEESFGECCKRENSKQKYIARYSILHGNEQLFTSKYKLYLPDEEELRREICRQKAIFQLQQMEKAVLKEVDE